MSGMDTCSGVTCAAMVTRKKKTKACTEFVHSLGYASTVLQADGESTMREMTTPLREKLAAHIQWSCESHTSTNSWFVTQQSAACAKKQWKERSTATSNLQKPTRYHLWILSMEEKQKSTICSPSTSHIVRTPLTETCQWSRSCRAASVRLAHQHHRNAWFQQVGSH